MKNTFHIPSIGTKEMIVTISGDGTLILNKMNDVITSRHSTLMAFHPQMLPRWCMGGGFL